MHRKLPALAGMPLGAAMLQGLCTRACVQQHGRGLVAALGKASSSAASVAGPCSSGCSCAACTAEQQGHGQPNCSSSNSSSSSSHSAYSPAHSQHASSSSMPQRSSLRSAGATATTSWSTPSSWVSVRGLSTSSCSSAGAGNSDDDEGEAGRRAAIRAAVEAARDKKAKEKLEQRAAQEVMEDPMSMLMASRGMPLGISLDSKKNAAASRILDAIEVPQSVAGASAAPGQDEKPKPEPGYQMEALDEIFETTKVPGSSSKAGGKSRAAAEQERQQWSHLVDAAGIGGEGQGGPSRGVPQAPEVTGAEDSWGTTRQSPEEIARRLVQSNDANSQVSGEDSDLDSDDDGSDELRLAPGEEKYKTLEQMSKDIKGLDEVFEVLASVPWLDEDDLQQKELKGVAMVGLLGTLEEVGFAIRPQVERIWAGDHDDAMILECSAAKDQAALISILFHTKKIKEEYGDPSKGFIPAPSGKQGDGAPPTQIIPPPGFGGKQGGEGEGRA